MLTDNLRGSIHNADSRPSHLSQLRSSASSHPPIPSKGGERGSKYRRGKKAKTFRPSRKKIAFAVFGYVGYTNICVPK